MVGRKLHTSSDSGQSSDAFEAKHDERVPCRRVLLDQRRDVVAHPRDPRFAGAVVLDTRVDRAIDDQENVEIYARRRPLRSGGFVTA